MHCVSINQPDILQHWHDFSTWQRICVLDSIASFISHIRTVVVFGIAMVSATHELELGTWKHKMAPLCFKCDRNCRPTKLIFPPRTAREITSFTFWLLTFPAKNESFRCYDFFFFKSDERFWSPLWSISQTHEL